MEFLGHLVGEGKMSVPAHRAEALGKYNKPVTKRGLRAFFRFCRILQEICRTSSQTYCDSHPPYDEAGSVEGSVDEGR